MLIAGATTVVGVVLSCTAAYALSQFRFPGRKLGLTAFLVVQMFPATMLLLPLYVILDKLALLNSVAGLGELARQRVEVALERPHAERDRGRRVDEHEAARMDGA